MDSGNLTWIIPLATLAGGAIGWLSSQYWQHRQAKRQAAGDAGKILSDKKKLLEELRSKAENINDVNNLTAQIDEVNSALLGLHAQRLRQTLKDADLPPEDILIAGGRSKLQPQEVSHLKKVIAQINALPPSLSTGVLRALGKAYYYLGQYQDAKDIYNKILDVNPNDHDVLNNRGIICGKLGKYEEALTDFNRSLELRPDAPNTLNNRGLTYHKLVKYEEALADYNRSLELKPDAPNTLNNRGGVYAKLERYEEALADFNHSQELRPEHPDTIYNLSCLFSLWGKTKDALDNLEKAISLDKNCCKDAKTDKDFDNIREDPRFKKLVGED